MFDYRVGIEEEFFVIDARTRNVRERMPTKFFQACKRHLQDQVTNELLQTQIEVLTSPCRTMGEGRQELWRLRRVFAEQAARHGLGIVAAAYASACSGVSRNRRAKTATAKSWKTCRWWASVTCSAACTSMWRCPIHCGAWRSCIARCLTCTCFWR